MPHGLGRFLLRPPRSEASRRHPFLLLVHAHQLPSDKTASAADGEPRNKVIPIYPLATSRWPRHDQILQFVPHGEPGSGEVLPRLRGQVLRYSDARQRIRRLAECAVCDDAEADAEADADAGAEADAEAEAEATDDRDAAACHRCGHGMASGHHEPRAESPDHYGARAPSTATNRPGSALDGAPACARGDGDHGHQLALPQSDGPNARADAQHGSPCTVAPGPRGADNRRTCSADRRNTRAATRCRTAAAPDNRSAGSRSSEGPHSRERGNNHPVTAREPAGRGGSRRPTR